MTMTTTPLPPEEIERLKTLLAEYIEDDGHNLVFEMHSDLFEGAVNALPALLAEIGAGRAGAERVRDDALAEAEALAEKFAEDNGMRSDGDIRGAAREQAAEDIAAGIAALRQATPPSDGAPDPNCPDCLGEGGNIVSFDPPLAYPCACTGQAAQPATRADLAQVGAQPAATVSEAHANVFRDVEVRWGERGFGLAIRHRVSGEVLAEIPAGFTLQGLCIRPAVPSDYEAATAPTSGAGDEGDGR